MFCKYSIPQDLIPVVIIHNIVARQYWEKTTGLFFKVLGELPRYTLLQVAVDMGAFPFVLASLVAYGIGFRRIREN